MIGLIPGAGATPGAGSSTSTVWTRTSSSLTSTVAALPGYRYHLVQVSGFAGQPAGGNKEESLFESENYAAALIAFLQETHPLEAKRAAQKYMMSR